MKTLNPRKMHKSSKYLGSFKRNTIGAFVLIFIALTLLIWKYHTSPAYDMEIPYSIRNETSDNLQITYYFLDIFSSNDVKLETTAFELLPHREGGPLHPEYFRTKKLIVFIEIQKNGEVISTYSLGEHGKNTKLFLLPTPFRIVREN